MKRTLLTSLCVAACACGWADAQSLTDVPGVVVDQQPTGQRIYIGTPSITIMPNGDYFSSHDLFGSGSTEATSGITKVFRSTDKGKTWTRTATITDQFWSTIFQHNGALYIWGYRNSGSNGDILIRKSTDGGVTWSNPSSSTTGLLRDGDYGGTANTPVIYNGRLWLGQGARVMSAPVDADLLNASSWTLSNNLPQNTSWLNGTFTFWSEGQVVASPQTGVVLLPKVGELPKSALIKVNAATGNVSFDPADFINLPGGEKKFGAQYDPVSQKFYVLDNPVLPAHANDPKWTPALIRNTAAVLSSKDLRHWDVEKLFLYSANVDYEGFQYLNFAIDGNDLAVISRTAFDVGGTKPPRGHDSNLMTFHTIKDFRSLSAKHVLVADTLNNQVLRYEVTQTNTLAPLGQFAMGSTFAGSALNHPFALAQTSNGDVYIGEQADGGRILQFDALGNFKQIIAAEGAQFTGQPESLAVGTDGSLFMSVAFGTNSDKIYRIDPVTRQVSTFVNTTFASGTLNNPRGMAVASDGNLYVADRDNNFIRKFDGKTGQLLSNISIGNRPQDMVWSAELNRLIVANRDGNDTGLFDLALRGSSTTLFDSTGIGSALGITVVDGQIFWSDYDNSKVYKLTGTNAKFASIASGLSGPGHLLAVAQPAAGERGWVQSGSGDWNDPVNWYYWGIPDTADEIANFGSAIDAGSTINIAGPVTTRGLRFRSNAKYLLAGAGSITIESSQGNGVIDVELGSHELWTDVKLASDTDLILGRGAALSAAGDVDLAGQTLRVSGDGQLTITGAFHMHGGTLQLSGANPILFGRGSTAVVDGNLLLALPDGTIPQLGDSFNLLRFQSLSGPFNQITLPLLQPGLNWDVSDLYTNGTISVAPEPQVAAVLILAAMLSRRARKA
jgi:streptogramin lyase